MVDVDHGFYYVKFDLKADRETVIGGGPWMLFDHYVAVACWTPELVAPMAKVDCTMVWILFPGLNMMYYDESFLLSLASCVGRPIKVDTNTLRVARGRYVRVCMEIDLIKSVVGRYNLGGHYYKVMYEGLHVICKTCGCYGHVTRKCSITLTIPSSLEINVVDEQLSKVPEAVVQDNVNPQAIVEHPSSFPTVNNSSENYGEWLTGVHVLSKNKNQKRMRPDKGGGNFMKSHAYSSQNGSIKLPSSLSTVGAAAHFENIVSKYAIIPSFTFGEEHNSRGPTIKGNNDSVDLLLSKRETLTVHGKDILMKAQIMEKDLFLVNNVMQSSKEMAVGINKINTRTMENNPSYYDDEDYSRGTQGIDIEVIHSLQGASHNNYEGEVDVSMHGSYNTMQCDDGFLANNVNVKNGPMDPHKYLMEC
ncbi:unnamed protein product [Lupinus luteus]|uniref:CCHC-type domain-containing protein n=1 Tax=Lupinus luteus TaxID=3873 RepID=A0AAV1X4J4_LUPLU